MFALLILSLAGQCAGGQCSIAPAPIYLPAEQPRTIQPLRRYMVQFDGMDFEVEGHTNPARGTIVWSRDHEFNRRALADAIARRDRPAPAPRKPVDEIRNFGLAPEHMGNRVLAQASPEARRFIAEAKEEAGQGKLHLTVIGSDDARAPVMNDVLTHPAFASLKDRLHIQGYKPDEWPVDPALGYQTQGSPSILLQTPKGPKDPKGGRVVYRALDYSMGPQVLATAIAEEVRRADPSYNPTVDPGPAAGGSAILGLTSDQAAYTLIGGVVLLALITAPRKDN